MQISNTSKFATLIAAGILALSSSVYAADNSGKSTDGASSGDNACAEGSGTTSTETNANCTTK